MGKNGVAAVAVAVATTGWIAVAASAAPAAPTDERGSVESRPAAVAPPLAPVTEHPIDPVVLAALEPEESENRAVEVVQLQIIGGGLTLGTDRVTVELQPTDSSRRTWSGVMPSIEVVDARGTHEGWTVRWRVVESEVDGVDGALQRGWIRLEPGPPVVIHGLADGLLPGATTPPLPSGGVLLTAGAGTGGGTYEATGVVTVRVPPGARPQSVALDLAFELEG